MNRVRVEISIPEGIMSFEDFLVHLWKMIRVVAQKAFQMWIEQTEEEYFQGDTVEGIRKERQEIITVWTMLGEYRIKRYKVSRLKPEGGREYWHPFDDLVGLSKRESRASRAVREREADLATKHSYRTSRDLLKAQTGCGRSHMTIWKGVQAVGGKRVRKQANRVERMREGKLEIKPGAKREAVVIEADGTAIRLQRSKEKHAMVKMGIVYDGKTEKKVGRRTRRNLRNKRFVVGMAPYASFGYHLFEMAEREFGVSRAGRVLFQSDGEQALENMREFHFWDSTPQVDIAHVDWRIKGDLREYGEILKKVRAALYSGKREETLFEAECWAKSLPAQEGKSGKELVNYLRKMLPRVGTFAEIKEQLPERLQNLCVRGTGAMEKNGEITIGRRMKRRGMSWKREGAANLLALMEARQYPEVWDRLWD